MNNKDSVFKDKKLHNIIIINFLNLGIVPKNNNCKRISSNSISYNKKREMLKKNKKRQIIGDFNLSI